MSKICANCGNPLSDETMFCVNCGTPAPTSAPEAAPTPAPAKKINVGKVLAAVKKDPKLRLIALAAAAVVAILIVIVLVSAVSNPWKSGMNNYINLVYKGKASAVVKAAPNEVWEYIDDEYGVSKDDVKKDNKDYADDIVEDAEDTYGENIKYKYKVVKQKKMTKKMVQSIGDALEENYDIDGDTVKAGYVVQMEYEISGKDAFNWGESTFFFVKIQNKWYRVSEGGSLLGLSEIMSTETFAKEAGEN